MFPEYITVFLRLLELIVALVLGWLFTDANEGIHAPKNYKISYGRFGLGTSIASAMVAAFVIWQQKIKHLRLKLCLMGLSVILFILWLCNALWWFFKYKQVASGWDRRIITSVFLFISMGAWAVQAGMDCAEELMARRAKSRRAPPA